MKQVKYWLPNHNGDIMSGECESMRYGNNVNIIEKSSLPIRRRSFFVKRRNLIESHGDTAQVVNVDSGLKPRARVN